MCNNISYDLDYEVPGANTNIPNNYWCTTNSAIIESHIYDGYDNINLGLVLFMPVDTTACNITTGITENINPKKFNVEVYPNPATDNLIIEIPLQSTIKISNIQGQLLKTFTTTSTKTNIDVSEFPSGVYIVELKSENGIAVKKFVKE